MKPGFTLHPLRTGLLLYQIPGKRRFWIKKVRHIRDEAEEGIDAGGRHIEIVGDIVSFTPEFEASFRKEMKHLEELKKDNITFSVHINHVGFSYPTHYKYLRYCTTHQFQYFLGFYAPLEPTHYTLHPGPDEMFKGDEFKNLPTQRIPIPIFGQMKDIFKKGGLKNIFKEVGLRTLVIEQFLRNSRAFKRLRDLPGIDLSKICIENPEGMTRKEYDSLFSRLSKKYSELGCLLDVGHLLVEEYLTNKYCLEDFIEKWGKKKNKIKAVHCHDVVVLEQKVEFDMKLLDQFINDLERALKGREEDSILLIDKLEEFIASCKIQNSKSRLREHRKLGTGILNLPSLLRALKAIDFQGPIIFEGGKPGDLLPSVRILAQEIEKVKNTNKSRNS